MKLLLALFLPLTGLLIGQAGSPAASATSNTALAAAVAQPVPATETVLSVHVKGTTVLLQLSNQRGGISSVNVSSPAISTDDGYTLASAAIRPGDRIAFLANHRVQDNSQHMTTLQGVVCHAPSQSGDTMAIERNRVCSVLVDTLATTKYRDQSQTESRLNLLQEGDVVQVRGSYDRSLEEMTQTATIVRIGPVQKPIKGASHHA